MNIEVSFPVGTPERHKQLFCARFKDFGYEFTESADAPYLVATTHIHISRTAKEDLLARAKGRVTIFDTFAEAIFPDFNLFDYVIGMDELECNGRMICAPLRMEVFLGLNEQCRKDIGPEAAERPFCNFIYSNPRAHPQRDQLFHALNAYRKVDSLGKHLNNVQGDGLFCGDGKGEDWLGSSVQLKSRYKFTIASENAFYHGYTSEKLLTSFMAGSLPIYWGNPDIAKDYAADAFINAHDFASTEELVEYVKFLDNNPEEYLRKLRTLPRTPEQEARYTARWQKAQEQLRELFTGDAATKAQKGDGFWADLYREGMKTPQPKPATQPAPQPTPQPAPVAPEPAPDPASGLKSLFSFLKKK